MDEILDHHERLCALIHSRKKLTRLGYVFEPLTPKQLDMNKRCQRCNWKDRTGRMQHEETDVQDETVTRLQPLTNLNRNQRRQQQRRAKNQRDQAAKDVASSTAPLLAASSHGPESSHPTSVQAVPSEGPGTNQGPQTTVSSTQKGEPKGNQAQDGQGNDKPRCQYHTGYQRNNGRFSCCGGIRESDGCHGASNHLMRQYGPGELERTFQMHTTPGLISSSDVRLAVAIDCEMATSFDNECVLIRVTAIDYYTLATLVDALVKPDAQVKNYNTRWSGVSKRDMDMAVAEGKAILGSTAAREAVWRFVGPETVVIGHGLQNDFKVLRMMHARVVDSYVLEADLRDKRDAELLAAKRAVAKVAQEKAEAEAKAAQETADALSDDDAMKETLQKAADEAAEKAKAAAEAVDAKEQPQKRQTLNLKALTKIRLGRAIQVGDLGHDSWEDAKAARDLVHLHAELRGQTLEPIM